MLHLLISAESQTVSLVSDMNALLSGLLIIGIQRGISAGVARWKIMVGVEGVVIVQGCVKYFVADWEERWDAIFDFESVEGEFALQCWMNLPLT